MKAKKKKLLGGRAFGLGVLMLLALAMLAVTPVTAQAGVTLKGTEGKNAKDVTALRKIIEKQVAMGVDVTSMTHLDGGGYYWKSGRLVSINWGYRNSKLKGSII